MSEFNGYDLANVRVFFQTDDGDMRPGKAGLDLYLLLSTPLKWNKSPGGRLNVPYGRQWRGFEPRVG